MSGIFNNFDKSGNKYLILPTVIQVGKEELDYWTSMTCFYDKYWEFNPKFSTVPIAFMHITSVTEIITAQGAEKRVIVYEAPTVASPTASLASAHPATQSNIEVIMDNVVVQPKQYQMEVIIPNSLIGPYHKQGLSRLGALVQHMGLTYSKGSSAVDIIAKTLRGVEIFLDVVETATSVIDTVLGVLTGSSQMATMNKNSIQAMASKGRVVLFKKWGGYGFCYGIITKIDISQKPSEKDVFRGSITFQETPILNISQKTYTSVGGFSGMVLSGATQIARVLNLALALPFMAVTGVVGEAGGVGSKDASDKAGEIDILSMF